MNCLQCYVDFYYEKQLVVFACDFCKLFFFLFFYLWSNWNQMIIIVPSLKLNNEHSIKADCPIIMLTMRTINGENKKRKKVRYATKICLKYIVMDVMQANQCEEIINEINRSVNIRDLRCGASD